ncbi:thioesterase II family protein [Actinophytocola oryzae]|uniref:Surfactin synthase thioesterase subunit n=1 Tax=Actinophytocola oryzae TaxID=502181 RepID=A0A4R7VKP5_9PSEU|nr:alpha/beta fold hydrolase [Actinophytocola oryzae]TDV49778.1 surfactin synthase thioesterase subunit [Actinophytocola oryzae]
MATEDRWIRRFGSRAAPRTRLICFPHMGGSAGFFGPLAARLRPDVEVLAVQYPGRLDRRDEPALDTIERLADGVCAALRSTPPERLEPFGLFGHSMGALVAYEVARRLEDHSGPVPTALIVSGKPAPHCAQTMTDHPAIPRDLDRVQPGQVDIGQVATGLRGLAGTDHQVLDDPDLLEALLPVLRADIMALRSYVPPSAPPLCAPIAAFVGDRDATVDLAEAQAWQEFTTGGFELHVLPGDHFYLAEAPTALCGRLAEILAASA